jgi:hypothetical protein
MKRKLTHLMCISLVTHLLCPGRREGVGRLEDDVMMTINKALAHSDAKYKRIGALGSLAVLRRLGDAAQMALLPEDPSDAGGQGGEGGSQPARGRGLTPPPLQRGMVPHQGAVGDML